MVMVILVTSFIGDADVLVEVDLHFRKVGVDRGHDVRGTLQLRHQLVDGLQF